MCIRDSYVDSANPCQFWIEATIPADMGGWWIREVGIFATTSKGMVLFAVGNHAPYHKSLASSGLATEHTVRIPVLVTSDAVIEIKVDSSVYATKADLDEMRGTLTGAQTEQMKMVRHLGRHDADIVALQSGARQTNRTLSALQRTQATDNACLLYTSGPVWSTNKRPSGEPRRTSTGHAACSIRCVPKATLPEAHPADWHFNSSRRKTTFPASHHV